MSTEVSKTICTEQRTREMTRTDLAGEIGLLAIVVIIPFIAIGMLLYNYSTGRNLLIAMLATR